MTKKQSVTVIGLGPMGQDREARSNAVRHAAPATHYGLRLHIPASLVICHISR
ncbi:hypothetical protein WEI85_29680 [Actinomycetes bacterium KLBMP 9797]